MLIFGHVHIEKSFHGVTFYLQPAVKNVEVVHESDIGVVKPQDNLPCEFCEQLVIHLRDILVANTTEGEFEEVLKGLCKQTGSFKEEVSSYSTKICHDKQQFSFCSSSHCLWRLTPVLTCCFEKKSVFSVEKKTNYSTYFFTVS